jgi:hypothetical protein
MRIRESDLFLAIHGRSSIGIVEKGGRISANLTSHRDGKVILIGIITSGYALLASCEFRLFRKTGRIRKVYRL